MGSVLGCQTAIDSFIGLRDFAHGLLSPNVGVENEELAIRKHFWTWFVQRNAVTLPAGCGDEITSASKLIEYLLAVSRQAEQHGHSFVDGKARQPVVVHAPGGERRNRQARARGQAMPHVRNQLSIEVSLRERCIEIDLN